jgi:hypothetical protein
MNDFSQADEVSVAVDDVVNVDGIGLAEFFDRDEVGGSNFFASSNRSG